MATAESVKTKIQGLIDTANTATGNNDADLTTAVNSLVAGFGAGGGGGSMEMGEATVSVNSVIEVNVTSKKSNFLLVPQSFSETFANHNMGAAQFVYTNDSGEYVTARLTAANSDTATNSIGTSYWTITNETVFSDSTIALKHYYAAVDATISYYWFAW